jgi:cleavage stimulation factor subunit 2
MSGQLGMPMGTPPQGQGLYPPPPPPQQQPNSQDTSQLMQQVLAMSQDVIDQLPQDVIDQLPPGDRAQIMALRASYGR